jgi:hypothetical protein
MVYLAKINSVATCHCSCLVQEPLIYNAIGGRNLDKDWNNGQQWSVRKEKTTEMENQ